LPTQSHAPISRSASDSMKKVKLDNRIHLSLAPELTARLQKFPGISWNDRLKSVLSAAEKTENGSSEDSDNCASALPAKLEIVSASETAKKSYQHLQQCEVRDLPQERCLRKAPERVFKIDPKICGACEFIGNHYPAKLCGMTRKEIDRREWTRRINEQRLELERIKEERTPVRVIY
jgi:hypothetical protein